VDPPCTSRRVSFLSGAIITGLLMAFHFAIYHANLFFSFRDPPQTPNFFPFPLALIWHPTDLIFSFSPRPPFSMFLDPQVSIQTKHMAVCQALGFVFRFSLTEEPDMLATAPFGECLYSTELVLGPLPISLPGGFVRLNIFLTFFFWIDLL